MAGMDGDTLGDAIKAAIDAVVTPGTQPDRQAIFRAIGNAIVQHIKDYAVVDVQVDNVTQVQPGQGISGPGTGSGTIA